MIAKIWSGDGYPATGADSVSTNVADPLTTSPTNLLRVDQLTIDLTDQDEIVAQTRAPYVWYPSAEDDNNTLVIYHTGHTADYEVGGQGDMIRALVEAGYTVCGVHMPDGSVVGHNLYPTPTANFNSLKYFVEPVVRALNELSASFGAVYMTGISGGGWTTTMLAALDERIARSVQIAGTFPLDIVDNTRDFEQFLPGLLTVLPDGYKSLYLMACTSNRRQMQLNNAADSCCFKRVQYDTKPYAGAVTSAASAIGGAWSLVWDETHSDHQISEWGRGQVLDFFAAA